jgi:putative transposase
VGKARAGKAAKGRACPGRKGLAVSGLARTRLARSVHDAGWSTFTAMLEYMALRHGRRFARIDRWFPRDADSTTLVELVSAGTPVPHPAVKREPAGSTA